MKLLKLTMVETGNLPDGIIRPYEADFTQSKADAFVRATEEGTRVNPNRLARVTSGFIVPSAGKGILSNIENGWDSKRIMFAMVVEIANYDRVKQYEYITGFTNHSDCSKIGGHAKFDRNMKLYFNNITRIHMTETIYRDSPVWQPKIKAHDQILHRSSVKGDRHSGLKPATLRPTDLFRRSGSDSSFGSFLRENTDRINNMTGGFTSELRTNTLENNSPAHFLSRGISSYLKSSSNPEGAFLGDRHQDETVDAAVDLLDENLLENDPYIQRVMEDINILRTGYIYFGDLMDMNPDFDEDRNLFYQPLELRKRLPRSENCASWSSADTETIAATIIAQSLPAIMINAMYSKVDNLVINTRARMGEYKVITGPITPFIPGLRVLSSLDYFESTVEHILIPEITNDGMLDIEATIDANIDQDIEIMISIDDGEERYYRFPAFAGSMLAPTLADDVSLVDDLSDSIIKLASAIDRGRSDAAPTHTRTPEIVLGESGREGRQDSRRDRRDDREEKSESSRRIGLFQPSRSDDDDRDW